jgi:hypothetical protein
VYSFEYTDFPKAFVTQRNVDRCCTDANRGNRSVLGHSCTNASLGHCYVSIHSRTNTVPGRCCSTTYPYNGTSGLIFTKNATLTDVSMKAFFDHARARNTRKQDTGQVRASLYSTWKLEFKQESQQHRRKDAT